MRKIDKIKMPNLTIGEFCDWFTINQIKRERIEDGQSVMKEIERVVYAENLADSFFPLVNILLLQNQKIWKLMDKIIIEENLEDVGITAKLLVETNYNRVRIKNEISQMFGDNAERKNYGKGVFKL